MGWKALPPLALTVKRLPMRKIWKFTLLILAA